ncbi:hypothetical protein HYQ45_015596 [Verticillium longisporum]|uniref:Myb-like domain-containing protein n=1 Tax=Verticillium longisporum TaxID=100787 RepID=A0A0G4LFL2_VERLO|nr:hypothetical protein HYQ45_015596 [Verticillium longisporum]KAG7126072.1 hypothetical protein HYQ44_001112 [Verticillium longisporum]KAG7150534.1 hypothetical protein HYQ46_000525 [Verticillium longisporum]CRK20734.1 hypothetical protein BN1723_002701 [Verticillium longisporum]CRK26688.1 hypothetical protein BN1708_014648 [Verticillium longisporum]
MPPKTAPLAALSSLSNDSNEASLPAFDDLEKNLFLAMFLSLKSKPDIDWEKTASKVSLKNADTCKTRYGQICRKYGIQTYNQIFGKHGAAATSSKGKTTGKASVTLDSAGIRKATGRVGSKGQYTIPKTEIEVEDDLENGIIKDEKVKAEK